MFSPTLVFFLDRYKNYEIGFSNYVFVCAFNILWVMVRTGSGPRLGCDRLRPRFVEGKGKKIIVWGVYSNLFFMVLGLNSKTHEGAQKL